MSTPNQLIYITNSLRETRIINGQYRSDTPMIICGIFINQLSYFISINLIIVSKNSQEMVSPKNVKLVNKNILMGLK